MKDETLRHARVLIVDDEPQNVRYLADVLRWAGCGHVEGVTDPRQALPLFRRFQPDLVILDLIMPEMDGFAVLRGIREQVGETEVLPILILTSDETREARRRALGEGARDFLTKPMSPTEVGFRVRNLIEARFLHLRCRGLEEELRREGRIAGGRPLDLALDRWAACLEAGPPEEAAVRRSRRVGATVRELARALGATEEGAVELARAALVEMLTRPTGEDAIPASSVKEPAPPDDGLRNGVAARGVRVPSLGAGSQNGGGAPDRGGSSDGRPDAGRSRTPLLDRITEIAEARGERWDGTGGPLGLAGREIPLAARLAAVAECFVQGSAPAERADAAARPNAAADVLRSIEAEAGKRFDPEVVGALLSVSATPTA
ncbi:MAG: response regulator [Gemmatimonadota bacterium]